MGGIGLAIAKKCAADGANIVIAAKTDKPHPKLEGTIYTAAKEVELAGGKALPIVCDIRDDENVAAAIEKTIATFGSLDVVINNASAIYLRNTTETPMKRFDLMSTINSRGTFLTSKLCIPHLRKSAKEDRNPHILNISPPLNLDQKWFKDHTAYTIAKYGMSMCVLGMSAELKSDGINVNALWPTTGIATAAIENLAGKGALDSCRKPQIMADAAYAILSKPTCSGNFFLDEEVLTSEGITDFSSYAVNPTATLMPDFFVEETAVRPKM